MLEPRLIDGSIIWWPVDVRVDARTYEQKYVSIPVHLFLNGERKFFFRDDASNMYTITLKMEKHIMEYVDEYCDYVKRKAEIKRLEKELRRKRNELLEDCPHFVTYCDEYKGE